MTVLASSSSALPDELPQRFIHGDGEFAAAQATLFGVLQRNPQDKVAWHHLMQATQALEHGAAENWTGLTVMTAK